MNLVELWSQWLSGDQLSSARLLGWPLLAWGRLGKALQFAAGLTVVLDLVGPDGLRALGRRLHDEPWRRLASFAENWAPVIAGLALIGCLVVFFLFPATIGSPISFIVVLTILITVGYLLVPSVRRVRKAITTSSEKAGAEEGLKEDHGGLYARVRDIRTGNNMGALVEVSIGLPFLLVTSLPALLWIALSRGLFLPVTRRLADMLDRSRPAHPLRWTAFVLFVVGFHFDLLAS